MDVNSPRWTTVSDSPHDHEREALAFLRQRLFDRDPYRVWSNFEFVAPSGKLYEVDALAITDNGVHLIEIKSYPGEIGGDGSTWHWRTPEDRRRSFDNPRSLANHKAKALKEVLSRTKAFAKHGSELPYINEVVFLSDPDLTVTLTPPGRHHVYGRDVEPDADLPPQRANIGGIVAALTDLDADARGRPRRRVNKPLGERIAKAVDQAGIRERSSRRRIHDYELGELLDDIEADRDTGIAYQDFLVSHASLDLQRRLRLYPLELNATAEQREVAARAARREFEHLHRLQHPGVLSPVDYFDHERGPCLLFDHDPEAQRLDRWLTTPAVSDQLGVIERLDLVRDVAEALAHAHEHGVYHRSLCPSAVLVAREGNDRAIRLGNWHAGARVGTGDAATSYTGTTHLDALAAGDAVLYRAPEHGQPMADPAGLDVFSIGCLTSFVFTGTPPAPTPSKLHELLATTGYLPAEAVGDGVDEEVTPFIASLTDKNPANRPTDMAEVLAYLDHVEEVWTAPEAPEEPHATAARRGSTLGEGRFEVLSRFGRGSTAFTLLARDTAGSGRVVVLKVAEKPELNERLRAEAATLGPLHHASIVELVDGPIDLDGHTTLVLSYVGPKVDPDRDEAAERVPRTLGTRVAENIGAELVERWGDDLLDAVRYLEQMGVAHRDIKPENLGIAPRGDRDELHLVLFDFSLSGAPLDRIGAGTPGYVDPFLTLRKRWDPAAERYSAAVVLYELCTGAKPIYGDGTADPALVEAPLSIDPALFEPAVADELVSFFERALARDAADRFGTADDMHLAWRQAFRAAGQPSATPTEPGEGGLDFSVPAGTSRTTALAGLPLSNRAVNALERENILTVGDLADTPLNRLSQIRGVGAGTRRELVTAVAHLREALGDVEDADDVPLGVAANRLIPRATNANATTVTVLEGYLGLDSDDQRWPSHTALARAVELDSPQIHEILSKASERWSKQPVVTALRNWVAAELAAMAGLASLDQLADRLTQVRPNGDDPDHHRRAATTLLRAAAVVEADRTNPRWVRRVLDGGLGVLADDTEGAGHARADYANALAARTRELVEPGEVLPRSQFIASLRQIETPEGTAPLPDAHLAELATSLCPGASINNRVELYPRGLAPATALQATRRAFVTATSLRVSDVIDTVQARFPDAAPLPERPDLDTLIDDADLELHWDDTAGRYLAPELPSPISTGTSLARYSTAAPAVDLAPLDIDAAEDFEARLRRNTDHGGLLVLITEAQHLETARHDLERLVDTVIDVDSTLIAEVEARTADGPPTWDRVIDADAAGPGSASWQNLARLVGRATDTLTDQLGNTTGTVLLVHNGLLARYDRLDLVARWRDIIQDKSSPLKGVWLLVATTGTSDVPLLGSKPVPVITRNEWTRIPREWLRNLHRTEVLR